MLKTTPDRIMPTAIAGSYSRRSWVDASLQGRSFVAAPWAFLSREHDLDSVTATINVHEAADSTSSGWCLDLYRHPLRTRGAASAVERFNETYHDFFVSCALRRGCANFPLP